MGALVVAAMLAAAALAAGCGGGSDDSGSERAVEWTVDRTVGPRSIRLAATVEVCVAPVRLEPPEIEYSGHRVYLELRHTPERSEGEHDGCFLSLMTLHRTVTFKRDLTELILFDSSTDPPERRWPE